VIDVLSSSALDLISLDMTEIARLRKYKVDVASFTSESSKAEKNQVEFSPFLLQWSGVRV